MYSVRYITSSSFLVGLYALDRLMKNTDSMNITLILYNTDCFKLWGHVIDWGSCDVFMIVVFRQNCRRQRKNLKRGWSSSLSFSNPWTPLRLFSTWPSSRAGLCIVICLPSLAPSPSFVLYFSSCDLVFPFLKVCWAARRLCLRLWGLSNGGSGFSCTR